MKICFIASEIFAWGKYGGFGRATRMIARDLVRQGIEVAAVVPRRHEQKELETLDGFTVYSYPKWSTHAFKDLLKQVDADIYHSVQPNLSTYFAMRSMPGRRHVVTIQDPKGTGDWVKELQRPSVSRLASLMAMIYENNGLVRHAIKNADKVFFCARYLEDSARRVYRLEHKKMQFLPNPILVPEGTIKKAPQPTVAFVGRWDRRKRPELFFELAKAHPEIRFIAPGRSQDKAWDAYLRMRYGKLPNVEMPGFINQFESDALMGILKSSWIVVNTSSREGLPTSMLEALAFQCALLSPLNPEQVTSRFGHVVTDDDYKGGLANLLAGGSWTAKGKAGQKYVKAYYEARHAIRRHLEVYHAL